tara:strand:+ start:2780 stop:4678 length:1899 start_codon:yes stop_codon:yes gene_type:complete
MLKNTLLSLLFLVYAIQLNAQGKHAYPINNQLVKEFLEIGIIDQKVMMPMRDGIRLATDIYRPKTDKRVPIIFSRTPYNFNNWTDGKVNTRAIKKALEAVKLGYAYVIQNERGRYYSEGKWDILGIPLTDGFDAFTWMKDQEWSNGKIGTLGCSSTAEWQMAVAALDHPSHAAMVPQGFGAGVGTVGDFFEQGNWYKGGVEQLLFFSWLYGVEQDKFKPRIPRGANQEDLLRISRYYDLAPENPKVDMSEALTHLPIKDILKNMKGKSEVFDQMVIRKPNDPAWFKGGLYHDTMDFGVPSFWFASWYDVSVGPNITLFNHLRKNANDLEIRDNQYLVIAPTLHCAYTRASDNTIVGERSMGDATLNYDEQIYKWFDLWLKDQPNDFKENTPRVQYFTMGSNTWNSSEVWPPKESKMTTYYLHSKGKANSRFGDGKLSRRKPSENNPKDSFVYDPMDAVPSYGGNVCCTGNAVKGGAYDQQDLEARDDILVYTTEPFEKGVTLSGFVETTLYISSDAKDTDFTVKLIDVAPDGTAYNLDETIQRARYREGYDKEVFMEEGKVYVLELSKLATSNYFQPGHSIRIEITSSNFPRFARNLNTGGDNFDESKSVIANNNVHHNSKHLSKIVLPLIK